MSDQNTDDDKKFNLSRWAIEHSNFSIFLIILLMIAGVNSYFHLGQKEDPDFTFRGMMVRTYWPGATAAEMATQVTDKIEAQLQGLPNLDKVVSYAKPGETVSLVFVREDFKGKAIQEIWYQVRKRLGDISLTMPKGVIGPFFVDDFGHTYIAMYGVSANGFNYQELKDYADNIRNGLLQVPGVESVDILGAQAEKIYVEFSSKKMAELGISFPQLQAALQTQNAMMPAGVLNTPDKAVFVRVNGQYQTVQAVEDTRFRVGANSFRLGDFAKVSAGYEDPPSSKIRQQGKEIIALGVVMNNDANVLHVGEGLKIAMQKMHAVLPIGIEVKQFTDQSKVVKSAVGEFLKSLAESVIIVLLISFITLGFRTGLVVALTIPLVLGVTFMVMDFFDLNESRN